MNLDKLRGTGRTTRMLQEAIDHARRGKEVFVVTDSLRTTGNILDLCWELIPNTERTGGDWSMFKSSMQIRAQWPGGGRIRFMTSEFNRFDWHQMRVPNTGPDSVVLVDHVAIEAKFSGILKMLHRWDQDHPSSSSIGAGTPSSESMTSGGEGL